MNVQCPHCGAKSGVMCQTPQGQERHDHRARTVADLALDVDNYRYQFEVMWEGPDHWNIGFAAGMAAGTSPAAAELATVLRELADEIEKQPGPCAAIRHQLHPDGPGCDEEGA